MRAQSGKATPTIAVGNDNRTTSPELVEGLMAGIRAAGVNVLAGRYGPHARALLDRSHLRDGRGVQITGSHNPPEWNGVKMTLGRSSLYGDSIQELKTRILNGDMDSGIRSSCTRGSPRPLRDRHLEPPRTGAADDGRGR